MPFTPHQVASSHPAHYPHYPAGMGGDALPEQVLAARLCGCHAHEDDPTDIGQRPQIHIATGGVVALVIGGVTVTVTIGVVLTSLLLAVAIVAGSLAVTAMALAVVAMAVKSMARERQHTPGTTKRRK